MKSKEFIQNEIDNLEDILYNAKRDNCKVVIKQCEAEIKEYNQVLKDLEELEELKKIMGTPIQEIMKRLKVLEILKNRSYIIWVEKDILYSGRCDDIEISLDKEDFESEEDYKLIKEYLDGKD